MKLHLIPDDHFHFLSHIKLAESYSKFTRFHSHSAHSMWVEEGKWVGTGVVMVLGSWSHATYFSKGSYIKQ